MVILFSVFIKINILLFLFSSHSLSGNQIESEFLPCVTYIRKEFMIYFISFLFNLNLANETKFTDMLVSQCILQRHLDKKRHMKRLFRVHLVRGLRNSESLEIPKTYQTRQPILILYHLHVIETFWLLSKLETFKIR